MSIPSGIDRWLRSLRTARISIGPCLQGIALCSVLASGSHAQEPEFPANGSPLTPADLMNAPRLIERLRTQADAISAFLWSRFPPSVQQTLSDLGLPDHDRMLAVVEGLNLVLEGSSISGQPCFTRVPFSSRTRLLASLDPQGTDLIRLNRLVLEQAFPDVLRESAPPAPARPSGTALTLDQADYAPGTTARIHGTGFLAGEPVQLQVLHADGTPDTGEDHAPWTVVADAAGLFESSWHVCEDDCLDSTLLLSASGAVSGRSAQALFTDATAAPTYQHLASFGLPGTGYYSTAGLIQGNDGFYYGTAAVGGAFGGGTIFRVNSDGTQFVVLKNLMGRSGTEPVAELLQGTDGALYGTASKGGLEGFGTIFRLNTDGSGFTVLHDCSAAQGGYPLAPLMQASDGAFYGTTSYGGSAFWSGTIFRMSASGDYEVLHTSGSVTGLMQGADGALYGTTDSLVFRINLDGSGLTRVWFFDYVRLPDDTVIDEGRFSRCELVQGPDGLLYGTTMSDSTGNLYDPTMTGAGTVFRLAPDGSFMSFKSFLGTGAANPLAGLTRAKDGSLYGTTMNGGSASGGTVYKLGVDTPGITIEKTADRTIYDLNSDTPGITLIKSLDPTKVYHPQAPLLWGSDGALYGTGLFSLFKLNGDGSGFAVMKELGVANTAGTGARPKAPLLEGLDGNLYGTTQFGGSSGGGGEGAIFRVARDGSGFELLKSLDFLGTGASPTAGLVQDSDGWLYGTTPFGGADAYGGTVYRIRPDGTGFTVLKKFDGNNPYAEGAYPYGGLILARDGRLYGATTFPGTIYSLERDGADFRVVASSNEATGSFFRELTEGPGGELYFTAQMGGGAGWGTLCRVNPNGYGLAVLHEFDFVDGALPSPKLTLASDGSLFGTTQFGGLHSWGTLFKMNVDGSGFRVLASFDYATTGAFELGEDGVLTERRGYLYGSTPYGGSNLAGTLFRMRLDGSGFEVFRQFDVTLEGYWPYGQLLLASDGNLYGTTVYGGEAGEGSLYRLLFHDPLVANAGPDQSVDEGQTVVLDGRSSGPGQELAYVWEQVPGGTQVTLHGADTATPGFVAPIVPVGNETLSFVLTVTASGESSSDTVNVTVVNVNHPPVADAGPDQSLANGTAVAEGSPVTLHGEDSFDVDGDSFTFAWTQVGGGPAVSLTGADSANPGFLAPTFASGGAPGVVATLEFRLRVDDGFPPDRAAPGFTLADVEDHMTVEITNVNNSPTARAGDDQTVDEHTEVSLSGLASSDQDGDSLSFLWRQTGGPTVTLEDPGAVLLSFLAPFVGAGGADLTFELSVDDGYGGPDTDTVVVHVQSINDPPLVSAARPSIPVLWPPNHGLVQVGILGVSDPDSNATITITSVTQDEPTTGLGDGDTAVDAVILADGTVLLRAERSGAGNGRVYHIHFVASDPEGEAEGVVTVAVPHQKISATVDGGGLHDSTH